MRKTISTFSLLRAAAIGAITAAAASSNAQVLYSDATYNQSGNFDYNGNWSVGNEVVLASGGTSPDLVNSFDFQYNLSAEPGSSGAVPTGSVQITFYQNNGAPFNGYATPSQVLWQSAPINIGANGFTTATLFFPSALINGGAGVLVPDDFTWVATFTGITSSEEAGLSLYAPPTVGGNYADAWVDTGSGWVLDQALAGNPPLEFGAIIGGVPVPDTGAVWLSIAMAAACLAGFSKLNRRAIRT